jgi:hypothetical protein
MSHYTQASIAAQQKYESELITALCDHFGREGVEVHGDKKVELKTWQGSNSGRKANLVIRQNTLGKKLGHKVLANDAGYERNKEGGYDVHIDPAAFPKEHQDLIAMKYAELVATKRAKQLGYKVARKALEDGRIELNLVRS